MNWQQISLFAAALALSNGSHTAESLAKPAVRAAEPQPKVGVWGVDLSGMDTSVRPGDDFYRYANGKWLAANSIPPDLSDWGTIRKLRSDSEAQVHDLVEALPPHAAPGTSEQKAHDVYHSFLDVVAIEKIGLKSASKGLEDIAGAKSYGDVARLLGRPDLGLESPIRLRVAVDRRNPDRYIVVIGQSGLSLPDRDYYLKDAPVFAEIRKNFVAHLERMLSLGGAADAAAEARAIFDLETQIATRHWPVEKRREREITYNPRTRDQLGEVSEQFPWSEILAAGGLQEQREFVVAELDAVQALGDFFVTVPLETWRSYLKYHYLIRYANVLPNAFDAENFDFYGRVLNGREQQRERWTRAVNEAQGAVGEIFGKMYVRKYFSADAKRQVLELVENLRRAYARRIQNAAWLSAATKKAALEKLAIDGAAADPHDIVDGESILQAVHTAGVLRDVAAYGACDLRGGIWCVVQAVGGSRLRHLEVANTGLDPRRARNRIQLENLIQSRERHNDTAGMRHRTARQTGARTACHHGNVHAVADDHNFANLSFRTR